jgi:mono/diheme cytochrome c family protein
VCRALGSAVAVALTALVAGGCGGAGQSPTTGTSTVGGAALFARACGGCHTLTGHDTAADGGDLALGHLSVADIVSFTEVMPNRPRLSRADTVSVAEYVRAMARDVGGAPRQAPAGRQPQPASSTSRRTPAGRLQPSTWNVKS